MLLQSFGDKEGIPSLEESESGHTHTHIGLLLFWLREKWCSLLQFTITISSHFHWYKIPKNPIFWLLRNLGLKKFHFLIFGLIIRHLGLKKSHFLICALIIRHLGLKKSHFLICGLIFRHLGLKKSHFLIFGLIIRHLGLKIFHFSFSHFWLNNQASRVKENFHFLKFGLSSIFRAKQFSFSHFWLIRHLGFKKFHFLKFGLSSIFRVKEFSFSFSHFWVREILFSQISFIRHLGLKKPHFLVTWVYYLCSKLLLIFSRKSFISSFLAYDRFRV